MQMQTPFLVSSLLFTGFSTTLPPAAQASQPLVLSQQQPNQQLNELLRQGRELVKAGNYPQAIATYQQAANLDRQNPKIFSGIGYLEARQGHFQEAAKAYQQAIALQPRNSEIYELLGSALLEQGRPQEAIKALGVALKGRERFKEAIAAVEKARDLYRKKGESEGEKKAESLLQELKKSDR